MAVNRPVAREDEPVEFRPVPGQEEEWAGLVYTARSRLWDALGTIPVALLLIGSLILIGLGI